MKLSETELYEYKVEFNAGNWGSAFEEWLNCRGKEGWRVVAAFSTAHDAIFCVFERERDTNETLTT